MLALRFCTERLSPEQFGVLDVILRITACCALILVNPVGMYINRQLNSWRERGLVGARLRLGLVYLVPVALLSGILAYFFGVALRFSWANQVIIISLLVSVSILVTTVNQTLIPTFNLLGFRYWWLSLSLVTVWSGIGFAWLWTGYSREAVYWQGGMLGGMAIGALLAVPPFIYVFSSKLSRADDECISAVGARGALSFMLPLSLVVGLNWAQYQSYRFVLGEVASLAFLGIFAAGYMVSQGVFGVFETTAQQIFHPIFYRSIYAAKTVEGQGGCWRDYASVMIPLTVLTAVFVMVLADVGCKILISPAYRQQSVVFAVGGAVLEASRVIGNIYAMAAHATLRTRFLVAPQLLGAGIAIILLLTLIRVWADPSVGVLVSLFIAAFVYVVAMHRMAFREFKLNCDWGMLWALRPVLFSTASIVVVWLISLFFFSVLSVLLRVLFVSIIYIVTSWYILSIARRRMGLLKALLR